MKEFRYLPEDRQRAVLAELVVAAKTPLNGEIKVLDQQIEVFEKKYKITSEEMRCRLYHGQMHETTDICKWLMLLHTRGELVTHAPRTY